MGALAFPPWNLWWCAPLAVALFYLLTVPPHHAARTPWWPSALVGTLFGVVFMTMTVTWARPVVGIPGWVGLALTQVWFYTLAGLGLRTLGTLPMAARIVGATGLWVAMEAARSRFPWGGFGWSRLVFSQADAPTVAIASLGGAAAVTGLVVLAGALGAEATRAVAPPARRRGLAVWLLVAAIATPWAAVPWRSAPHTPLDTWQVAIVQGNTPTLGLDHYKPRGTIFANHAQTTISHGQTRSGPPLDLVVWPEAAADLPPRGPASAALDDAAAATDAPLLIGTYTIDGTDQYNTVLLWRPSRGPGASYHKRHPVPFGEYIPWRSVFEKITPLVRQVVVDLTPGDHVGTFTVNDRIVGSVICFEVSNDALVADTVAAGAEILTVHTNTAWFEHSPLSAQQLAMSRIRAIEHGRSVVHSSTVGISAFVTPSGAVHHPTAIDTQTVIEDAVQLHSYITISRYTRVPVELTWAFVGLCCGSVGLALGRRRLHPKESPHP